MSHLFVANWKMRMHFTQATVYCSDHKIELLALSEKYRFIICPSFVALSHITPLFKNTKVSIGAQDCSAFKEGSHTGEISAQSLQESGCSYCIVGHSERRQQYNETNESVAEKVVRLAENDIIPIICIGENKLDAINTRTYSVLEEQLNPIFLALKSHALQNINLIFAYEPAWAIGTGIIPEKKYLTDVFKWLHATVAHNMPHNTIQLLYGGSVNEHNITQLKEITSIQGFLIGQASTNFTAFKRIIESV